MLRQITAAVLTIIPGIRLVLCLSAVRLGWRRPKDFVVLTFDITNNVLRKRGQLAPYILWMGKQDYPEALAVVSTGNPCATVYEIDQPTLHDAPKLAEAMHAFQTKLRMLNRSQYLDPLEEQDIIDAFSDITEESDQL